MREAVGLFKTMVQLQDAVKELERTDFPRDALSVMGYHEDISSGLAKGLDKDAGPEEDPSLVLEAPVRPEEKTVGVGALISGGAYIGAIAVALAAGAVSIPSIIASAAIGGAGGATAAAILAKLLGDHFNEEIETQIQKGGLLLWVRTQDKDREDEACRILTNYGASHVRIHDL